LKLRGTFYVSDYLNHLTEKMPDWKKAAAKGHELGNHTLKHPCAGGTAGREFVKPDNDLNNLSFTELKEDILNLENILRSLDGKARRSFAYPCGDKKVGEVSYIDSLTSYFNAARGVMQGMPLSPPEVDILDVRCYSMAGQTGEEMIALVKEALKKNGLLVFLFHGVGGGHSLNVTLEAHRQLIHFLAEHEKDLWIAPMVDVADYVHRAKK
jgi:peptidoglycan/xylan/chitin deacetylase (PgdA/CDA1 family)